MKIEFNEANIKAVANQAAAKWAAKMQPVLDRIAWDMKGKPVDEAKRALQSGWRGAGGSDLGAATLQEWAKQLATGESIKLNVQPS